jgi:hypothetical protein
VQLDEKDKPKKYTPDELRKLRVDEPKYTRFYRSDLNALSKGQQVEVHLGRLKGAPKKPAAKATRPTAKDKDAAAEKDKAADSDLVVTAIVVLTQDVPPTAAKPKK